MALTVEDIRQNRLVQIITPEGAGYLDPREVAIISPVLTHGEVTYRTVWTKGGASINVLDTPENMEKLL